MPTDLEGNFYDYLHETGHASDDRNREVLRFYAPFFKQNTSVLDVGCGQGQFLELLAAKGIVAQGVDSDSRMVALCCEKGLSVVQADLFAYLTEQQERFDGVFSSNVVEHLSAEDVLRFIHLAYAALRPGGVVLLATPNPESLIVHLHEFWRDATHVRLYNAPLLAFMLHVQGFRDIVSGANPVTVWTPPADFSRLPQLWHPESQGAPFPATPRPWQELQTAADNQGPWWRRLRRRVARFLVQTVMFEDFRTLLDGLDSLAVGQEEQRQALERLRLETGQSVRALHTSQNAMLATSREIFVVGHKPDNGT